MEGSSDVAMGAFSHLAPKAGACPHGQILKGCSAGCPGFPTSLLVILSPAPPPPSPLHQVAALVTNPCLPFPCKAWPGADMLSVAPFTCDTGEGLPSGP